MRRLEGSEFLDHFWMNRRLPTQLIHYFTSWAYLNDYCHIKFPKNEGSAAFYDHCTLAHVNEKGNPDNIPHGVYYDFSDMEGSRNIRQSLDKVCDSLLVIGVVLHLLGYQMNMSYLVVLLFAVNTGLSYYNMNEVTARYGIDYIAYIQQAAAFWNGDTDYTRISSNLGPCFYPAGHIYHFVPAVWLHNITENAEYYITFVHHVIHSLIIVYIVKIVNLYSQDDSKSSKAAHEAQLIGFMLIASKEDRAYFSTMYNDEIMILYLVIAIYLTLRNRPIAASFFITLSLSVKVGALLLLPSFLGQL